MLAPGLGGVRLFVMMLIMRMYLYCKQTVKMHAASNININVRITAATDVGLSISTNCKPSRKFDAYIL